MKKIERDDSTDKAATVRSEYLYVSDFCEVKNWSYDFSGTGAASDGYNDCLCIVIVRHGDFLFDLSRQSHDMHTGHVLIDKPDYEYRLRPSTGQCSIFNFNRDFYRQYIDDLNLKHSFFFSNPNLLSLIMRTTPEIEYLHHQVIRRSGVYARLETDDLVMELLKGVTSLVTDAGITHAPAAGLKKFHLAAVEKAKEYMNDRFGDDISLQEISSFACTSPFHFSRIFRQFTSYSPHRYLCDIRLKHAEMLLRNSGLPVSDIAVQCGFNSAEYFATSFRRKYGISPSQYREVR